jgi:acetate CoA/acetoacetate CoA-transferase beta subunit
MDLVNGAKKVIISMLHTAKGNPKILKKCTLPLTGKGVVDMIITELAVFEFRDKKLFLTELMPNVSLEDVKKLTPASYEVALNT